MPSRFPHIRLGTNNVYPLALREGGVLLVDAGPDTDTAEGATWDLARAQMEAAGIAPSEVRVVLVTHCHVDHAGLAVRWALSSGTAGARILAGAMDVPAMLGGGEWNARWAQLRVDALRRHGCPPDVLEAQAMQAARSAYRWELCPPGSLQVAADGAEFALADGTTLRVIAAPGHTPGNLVAFVPETGDLYSGDTLLPDTVPTPGLHFPRGPDGLPGPRWPSLPPFLHSVRRLRGLPLRRVLPGHGESADEPARLLDRFEAHHARRAERIYRLLEEQPDTAYGLARRLFSRLPAARLSQAVTEVIGHLDLLAGRGEASREETDGGLLYRLSGSAGAGR